MRRSRWCLALLVAASLGCGSDGIFTTVATQPDAELARAQWTSLGLSRYTVEMRLACFCGGRVQLWHRLTVEDDRVVRAQLLQPNEAAAAEPELPPTVFPTVDALFERINTERQRPDGFTELRFDTDTGLPVYAVIGTLANDAGTVYSLRQLIPLPR